MSYQRAKAKQPWRDCRCEIALELAQKMDHARRILWTMTVSEKYYVRAEETQDRRS